MNSLYGYDELSRLGFRVVPGRKVATWERPVSNGLVLTARARHDGRRMRNAPVDLYLSHERLGLNCPREVWFDRAEGEIAPILRQVENNIPPLQVTSMRGVPFICRLLVPGDRFGRNARYTLEETDSPLLAFYDSRMRIGAYGQFVGELYQLGAVLAHDGPLRLHEGAKDWTLDATSLAVAQHWARLEAADFAASRYTDALADVRRALAHHEPDGAHAPRGFSYGLQVPQLLYEPEAAPNQPKLRTTRQTNLSR